MNYTLPVAGKDKLGGVKIGDGMDISPDGTLSIPGFNELVQSYKDAAQSVSDGKTLLAIAITEKGIETFTEDSFQTMADNVRMISGGGYDWKAISSNHRLVNFEVVEE